MKSTLANFGHDILKVKIIEVCSAKYSAAILKLDDECIVSPLIQCRIAIYKKSDGKTYIAKPLELAGRQLAENYYKDGNALISIVFSEGDHSLKTGEAIAAMRSVVPANIEALVKSTRHLKDYRQVLWA